MLRPHMTFGRDLGDNAAQIRQRGGFILAWKRDPGVRGSPAAERKTFSSALRRVGAAKSSLGDDPNNSPGRLLGGKRSSRC